ncbi:DUF2269 domain-containing protein [Streptantibioticus ferralitis]|uniref:DUF2269 domain-containing protein n=1 Tax=Streptantibioticus ferralitis TaxID=236510 RepID=A0ABT5Z5I8_9ACTN|nr:DUF2269 domain-containing protein [Streptantibioticus ferralitis]MDF2259018.1 DUF2269 domain-containing protein [Streptantibioticus ferralitis]
MNLTRRTRRAVLVLHVTVSVGWLGLTAALLALGITGAVSRDPRTVEAAYRGMRIFGDWLVIPVSLVSLLSGLLLSLGTHWGLARHRWVYTKFWLTLAATAASIFALRTIIGQAADAVAAEAPVPAGGRDLVVAPSVALSLYVFITAISVLKPWGRTRRGAEALSRP